MTILVHLWDGSTSQKLTDLLVGAGADAVTGSLSTALEEIERLVRESPSELPNSEEPREPSPAANSA